MVSAAVAVAACVYLDRFMQKWDRKGTVWLGGNELCDIKSLVIVVWICRKN